MASDQPRTAILAAAERLYADRGLGDVTLRDIVAEANVNLAAVNYHFGSKDALVAAVGERHVRSVNDRRLAALATVLEDSKNKPTVEAVVEAFVAPSIRFLTDGDPANFLLMRLVINRAKNDPENTGRVLREAMVPALNRFVDALALALPNAKKPALHEGLHLLVGSFLHSMTCTAMLEAVCPGIDRSPDRLIARLVAFNSAGIRGIVAI
jgi:AcrR family transcriptional regulator